jgi:predicted ATPase
MYIKELSIRYFKSFGDNQNTLNFGVPNGNFGSGLNIFLGENNTGKSTLFESFDFLRNKTTKKKSHIINKSFTDKNAEVEITFTGNIKSVIEEFAPDNKKAVLKERLYEDSGKETLKLNRTTFEKNPLKVWNQETHKYENVTGIDAPLKGMFETNFVWADTNPNEEAKFGTSTITGNLISGILNSFTDDEQYVNFLSQFEKTFNDENSNLKLELKKIEQKTQEVFVNQFGAGKIKFQFEQINPNNFFKNVRVYIDDGAETSMEEKGSGMQRAVALAMVQVYADILRNQSESEIKKPLFLFIDEPEICLHPKAQEKLLNALLEISKHNQIFISTHSPYFLSTKYLKEIALFICKSDEGNSIISNLNSDGFFPWSPTWGEINYLAYNLETVEFHNELYGRLQEVSENWQLGQIDNYLASIGVQKSKSWTQEKNGLVHNTYDVTLMTFIRNKIHHPENVTMQEFDYTHEELKESIETMIKILKENFS